MKLEFYPLTQERWNDLVILFGKNGACAGCWCTYWRQSSSEFAKNKGTKNKNKLRKIVNSKQPIGIVAYAEKVPIGWCAIAPREDYPRLSGSRILAPVDDQRVWSIVCFFVTRAHRRKGVTRELIKAAAEYAFKKGAKIVEAYPTDISKPQPDVFIYTGIGSAFRAVGFKEVERRSPNRPILRFHIKDI
ncbi:MAG: GNAT family N-acetyltransferase [Acidobacteria bacterium]|nr:MAG: GNAT family N-acetyltransferase [Acidobacteriota bacterium]